MRNKVDKTPSKNPVAADAAAAVEPPADQQKWVRVKIRRAIALGGLVLRPTVDGERIVPVEAVMLADDATRHTKAYVEVLATAERPEDGIPHVIAS